MNEIERVARAICEADCSDPDQALKQLKPDDIQWAWELYVPEATAAIAAMRGEPVAWLYEREDGSKDLLLDCNGEYARNLVQLGATETALYAGPTPPDSGKD